MSLRHKSRRISPIAWAIAPAALLFVLFFILPFGVMAALSFLSGNPVSNPNVTFTWRHYNRLVDSDLYFDALVATMRIGAITTVIALLVGYPLAHWMARMHSRVGHALLLMAVIAPLLTGIVVRTFAWMTLLGDRGVINFTLQWLGLAPLPLMYNEFGVIVGLVHIYVPFMVLTLVGVIGRIDRTLEEAARGLGAGRLRTFLEVTLPLSMPGVLAGSLLVFALAISAYVTPVVLGGNNVLTLPMLIYQQVSAASTLALPVPWELCCSPSPWHWSLATIAFWAVSPARGRSHEPALRRSVCRLPDAERRDRRVPAAANRDRDRVRAESDALHRVPARRRDAALVRKVFHEPGVYECAVAFVLCRGIRGHSVDRDRRDVRARDCTRQSPRCASSHDCVPLA